MSTETMLAADARRIKAMVEVDLATLKTLVADDCRYVHSSAMIDTKQSYLDKLQQGVFRYTWLTSTAQVVLPLPGGLVISHVMEAEIVMGGAARPYRSQAVAVWRDAVASSPGPQLVYFQATTLPAAST